jgi:sensor histidine kinase YesM
MLGEEQFRGTQIYDVIQDKNLNYYFATNEGIYCYNFYSYKKLDCAKTKSSSVFNFVINKEGTIYCHNLNNQIFEIKNDQCNLFYELTGDEASSDNSLSIADDDNLVVGARKILVINKKGIVCAKQTNLKNYLSPSFTAPNQSIHFHIGASDTILVYSKGKFSKHKLKINSELLNPTAILKIFDSGKTTYALDIQNQKLYNYDPFTIELKQAPENKLFTDNTFKRIYETGNEVWIAGTLPGVVLFENKENKSQFFFEDYFISNVYKDNEGNILLSTFDKGILVIPDLKVPGVINSFRDDPVTALYSNNTHGLILGTSKGNLWNYLKGKLSNLNVKGKRSIENIYGDPNKNTILFDNGGINEYNIETGEIKKIFYPSLKDATFISENKYFVGTNVGLFELQKDPKNNLHSKSISGLKQRIYSIEYDKTNTSLYASTAIGLFVIDSNQISKKITFNNEDIFPNHLFENGQKLYACTEKNGILIINKKGVIGSIDPLINGKTEPLKKIIVYNNTIIASSINGFFQFNMEGKLLRSISSTFGFSTQKVIDFKMQNEQLWVSHSGGVQQINLNYLKTNSQIPTVRFDKILINDESITPNAMGNFSSNQRKLQFIFSSPVLRNRESINYHFKLIGYDTTWTINKFDLNQVTYNALDPGEYTLMIKAENQGLFSEVVKYSFVIAHPIYAKWWFILLLSVLVLALIIVIYRWQLQLQQKKLLQINELNASKLAAIQSQMNPHFIFNSLNSIQDLVLKGDIENSYSYITTFSDLVRRTLSYSEKDFIDFDQEIKLLELYLSLEKLRFKKNFSFEIKIGSVEDIMIPPMLIQPFIENSLAHGLLHKDGEKKLKVTFELKEMLICRIEDNGVGRDKAKAIKQRQNKEHESFSGKATGKRLEILSHVFDGEFGYTYEDLFENGMPAGTIVTLSIPIKRKF